MRLCEHGKSVLLLNYFVNKSHFINEIAPIQFKLTNHHHALTDQNLRQVRHVRSIEIVVLLLCGNFVSPGGTLGLYLILNSHCYSVKFKLVSQLTASLVSFPELFTVAM